MNGGSSAPYLACTPCISLFVHCLIRVEAEGLLDYQGRAGIISFVRWNLRASARNRKKNGPKMDFGLTGKIGKKSPKNGKNRPKMGFFLIFGRFFPFLGDFFPIFPVRPKSIFGPFFSDFRRKPEGSDFLPGRQDRKSGFEIRILEEPPFQEERLAAC